MINTLASIGKGFMETLSGSTLIKIQMGIIGTIVAVMALITLAAIAISLVIRANPAAKRKIFDFIEKL